MFGVIVTILVGLLCIGLGISNARGNISTLHSYHRSRVKEEDVQPYGKQVGAGTIIIGSGLALYGVFTMITLLTEKQIFSGIGSGIMMIGLVVGLLITVKAMMKYNGGIF